MMRVRLLQELVIEGVTHPIDSIIVLEDEEAYSRIEANEVTDILGIQLTSGGSGDITYTVQNKTTTYNATTIDDCIFCNGTFTVNLPPASTWSKPLNVKNIGTGIITIDANSTETIDGNLTMMLTQYENAYLMSNSTNIFIL